MLISNFFVSAMQSISFRGKIINSTEEIVSNATIEIVNTNIVTRSDNNGDFKIDNLPIGDYSIKINAVGYSTLTQKIIISNKIMRDSKFKSNDNVKVVVRVRPPLARELEGDIFISTVQVHEDRKRIQLF